MVRNKSDEDDHLPYIEHLFNHSGIIINGEIYEQAFVSTDISMQYDGKIIPLIHNGSIKDLVRVVDTLNHLKIKEEAAKIRKNVIEDIFRSKDAGKLSFLSFKVIDEILPYIDEFDSRINDMARSELVELREKEILERIGPRENVENLVSKKEVLDSIKKSAKAVENYKIDYNLNIFTNVTDDGRETYHFKERKHRGNVIVNFPGKEPMIFKTTEKTKYGDAVEEVKKRYRKKIFREAGKGINENLINKITSTYNNAHTIIENEEGFEIDGAGLRYVDWGSGGGIYVYARPKDFAMNDIREGFRDRWYAFPNPPNVGVVLLVDDDLNINMNESHSSANGSILVDGDFEYVNFSSSKGNLNSFCGPEEYRKGSDEDWGESIARYIIHNGVYTLYNGMTPESMRTHHKDGVPGEGYKNPLSKLECITEKEVEEMNLVKSNLHETIPANLNQG